MLFKLLMLVNVGIARITLDTLFSAMKELLCGAEVMGVYRIEDHLAQFVAF
ncbi:hypothetical protein [Zhongshania sp.]|uniref:hypothetical protein n=1 Tax=Zhongshania sp. TaxID=1971902 RepID=UPI0039E6F634